MNHKASFLSLLLLAVTIPCTSLHAQDTTNTTSQTATGTNHTTTLAPGQMPYFDAVNDPIEGFNRCSWAVNDVLFRGVIYPLSKGYNFIAPAPVRSKVSNFGHNLTFPVRLVNSALQGKWKGAWEETKRFTVNTTVGIAGIFDPATHWKIGRSDEDFGQTMGKWGAGPGFYLMIPIIGPSNGRDALGKIVDYPLDLCFWITQEYGEEVWAHAIRPGVTFNNISGKAEAAKRELDSLVDPYQALRTLYSLNRERLVLDYVPSVGGDFHPDPTVGAVLFKPVTKDFEDMASTHKAKIPATGKKLPYSCWMQKHPAPLVCYIPGLGSARTDVSTAAYADMLYRAGYSVMAIGNPFQKEFMELGSTMAVPGYGPADCDDLVRDLKIILGDMKERYGDKITETCLTGVSHGGYFTLMVAAREQAGQLDGLSFDRYVAVNPPPSLARALDNLDRFFNAPLDWPADQREELMKETIYKALYFASGGLNVSGTIPLSKDESRFLIGLVFRYTLMSVIVDSQRRDNLGVLENDPDKFVRQKSYREIRQISYKEYMDRFVLPYLIKTGHGTDKEVLMAATDLTHSAEALSRNTKLRVQICKDDFLLEPSDITWFETTFGDRLTAYPRGGHLGNLHIPAVQEALVKLFPPAITEPTKP